MHGLASIRMRTKSTISCNCVRMSRKNITIELVIVPNCQPSNIIHCSFFQLIKKVLFPNHRNHFRPSSPPPSFHTHIHNLNSEMSLLLCFIRFFCHFSGVYTFLVVTIKSFFSLVSQFWIGPISSTHILLKSAFSAFFYERNPFYYQGFPLASIIINCQQFLFIASFSADLNSNGF